MTTAAIGALGGAVVVLGRRSSVDVPTAILMLATLAVLWRWRMLEPLLVLAAAALGLILYPHMRG